MCHELAKIHIQQFEKHYNLNHLYEILIWLCIVAITNNFISSTVTEDTR